MPFKENVMFTNGMNEWGWDLDKRFANGEIDEDEYNRKKEHLKH
jgi:uncharacterized membrane protein